MGGGIILRNYRVPTLTIAGSDSSGGAGIQADLKTFSAIGTYGMSVITAVTAQNTEGVFAVEELSGEIIKSQIKAIFDDIEPAAVKIGMVSSPEIIVDIVNTMKKYNPSFLVVDPVMISKSGYSLLKSEAKENLIKYDEKKYEGEFLELMRIGYEEMSDINLELSKAIDFSKGNVQYKFDDICEYEKWLCGV